MNVSFKILAIIASGILNLYSSQINLPQRKKNNSSFNLQKKKNVIQSPNPDIFGSTLVPIKTVGCDIIGLSNEDISRLMKLKLKIEHNYILFFGDTLRDPNYEFHKESSLDFVYTNYKITPDRLGITEDTIEVLSATFDKFADIDFLFFDKNIVVENEGVFFFLKKQVEPLLHNSPIQGDTVRCLYHEGKSCTGFVIQGTRKAGKVVHVMPQNQNVPLEIEEK